MAQGGDLVFTHDQVFGSPVKSTVVVDEGATA